MLCVSNRGQDFELSDSGSDCRGNVNGTNRLTNTDMPLKYNMKDTGKTGETADPFADK